MDENCDGEIDEEVKISFYPDADSDGYGVDTSTIEACTRPDGYADVPGDCDDTDPSINPDGTEICDDLDNDCDGSIDEDVTLTFYLDSDADGYGMDSETLQACAVPDGYADVGGDCRDDDSTINPGVPEVCDHVDNNCDGNVDEGLETATYYGDVDGDGYGEKTSSIEDCEVPEGYVDNAEDCDDIKAEVNPGATEVCNEVDDDCDGEVDENLTTTFYEDGDNDSFGNPESAIEACEVPAGYVEDGLDCDDKKADVHPDAAESCNYIDDNCDGEVDEGVRSTFYADSDGDGYGDPGSTTSDCAPPAGYVANADDCDDSAEDIIPAANGLCALGVSCQAILEAGRSGGDGVYVIDPDGPETAVEPFEVYCDMTTDGGGWTLVLNLDTSDGHVMWWANPLWTDSESYGQASMLFDGDHKSEAWQHYTGGTKFLLVVHDQGTYLGWKSYGKVDGKSMYEYFQGGDDTLIASSVLNSNTGGLWEGEKLVRMTTRLYANQCTHSGGGTCTSAHGGDPDGDRISSDEIKPQNDRGGGLGNWHDMGYCCSGTYAGFSCNGQTFRTVSEAQPGWGPGCPQGEGAGGYFGTDTYQPGSNQCGNVSCDTANWSGYSGYDYDYALFIGGP